ncbi:class I tRNA ligase family protein, partial [Bacteriovoracaceae bacterium]|nr:class I tRNA ligase family protein [Bacteriovoracaceae bacterium]
LRNLHKNNMLEKKTTDQWFDTELNMFLPDRFVYGTCPNQSCENKKAYSDECDDCGKVYPPKNLIDPKSTVSDATPVLRPTAHWWLNMWKVSDQLREWIATKQKTWRKVVYLETYNTVLPSVQFSNKFEEVFKGLKEKLPTFKSRYAPGKMIVAQFSSLSDLEQGFKTLKENGIESEYVDGWAHRSITRDVSNGVPVPPEIDEEMKGKTFYVWPESLVAPISFTRVALKKQGKDPELYKDFWTDPESKVYQFLGQDNIYFYVLMQGAMWFGSQEDPMRQPVKGELQLTDVFGNYHLQVDGDKMSKTKGNFYTGDQLLDEHGYSADQIRYFLAILSLSEKNSNFDFEVLKERNKFLAGPLNASFEKPISACLSKFGGVIPEGKLIGKTKKETYKVIQTYVKLMEKADYAKLLFMVENYARVINSLFAQYKPHDDRHDETERKDALFSCFFILKNIMIMLSPFAPDTMESLRQSLNLPESILSIDELGKPMSTNHKISEQKDFFPSVDS